MVRAAIGVVLERDEDSLDRSTTFAELDADSLGLVEVAEIVEEELSSFSSTPLHIPDADLEALRTVGDVVDYVLARL